MPRTEPLPEFPPSGSQGIEPLDDTRTRGRRPRTTPKYAPLPTDDDSHLSSQLQPRSRAPLIFAALVALSGVGFGTWWLTRPPPQTVHVEVTPPPPPPIRPIEPEAVPAPQPAAVVEPPKPVEPVVGETESPKSHGHVAKPGKHHGGKSSGHVEKATEAASPANPTAAPILP
jgi:hypothetical protein